MLSKEARILDFIFIVHLTLNNWFCSVLFSSVLFSSVQFCSVQFCSGLFSSVQFCSVLFSYVQLYSAMFSYVQLFRMNMLDQVLLRLWYSKLCNEIPLTLDPRY